MGSQDPDVFLRSLADASDRDWLKWLEDQQKAGHSLFKVDVTFTSTGTTASADIWLEYFDTRVVTKLNKALGLRPRMNKGSPGPVNASAREYEGDEKTAGYKGLDWRCPAHIHSIVVVPDKFAGRMTSTRVKSDLESLERVSSVHIEPVLNDPASCRTLRHAYFYMRKGKIYRSIY